MRWLLDRHIPFVVGAYHFLGHCLAQLVAEDGTRHSVREIADRSNGAREQREIEPNRPVADVVAI
jgi:hypothetical protein